MPKKRFLLLLSFLLLSLTWLFSSGVLKREKAHRPLAKPVEYRTSDPIFKKLRHKAAGAKQFVKQKGYNGLICFMIDMSVSSGQGRFFVYDLKKDTIINTGLVTHGRCNEYWLEDFQLNSSFRLPGLPAKNLFGCTSGFKPGWRPW